MPHIVFMRSGSLCFIILQNFFHVLYWSFRKKNCIPCWEYKRWISSWLYSTTFFWHTSQNLNHIFYSNDGNNNQYPQYPHQTGVFLFFFRKPCHVFYQEKRILKSWTFSVSLFNIDLKKIKMYDICLDYLSKYQHIFWVA